MTPPNSGSGFGFGFGPADNGDEGEDKNQNQNDGNSGFDLNEMMRQMQSEFQKILPGTPLGFLNPATLFSQFGNSGNQSALPKDVIREVAKRFIQAQGSQPVGANDQARCEEALSIANVWLDQATVFPQVASDHPAISPIDWLNNTVDGWHSTF
jgi:hypothetical protein